MTGVPYTHPGFDDFATFPNTSDVGIVVLDKKAPVKTFGALPALGVLDDLASRRGHRESVFEAVGYGLQGVKPDLISLRDRYKALPQLVDLRGALTDGYNLHTSNDPGFGDSGGPILRGDNSNVVVAVTSFGLNANCKGADYAYRVDIANAQVFIAQFL